MTESTLLLFPGHTFVRNFLTLQDPGSSGVTGSELTLTLCVVPTTGAPGCCSADDQ